MTMRTTIFRALSRANVRRWLTVGVAGFLIVLAVPTIRDAWQVNRAGMLLNRAIVLGFDAGVKASKAQKALGTSSTSTVGATAGTSATPTEVAAGADYVLTPEAKALITRSMALMEAAALRGPHTASREVSIWRTYGAAAQLLPSDHAFELLSRALSAGRLDWYGELWLGEVASATGHWDAAAEAYRRVDVSNLLVYWAEVHIQSGQKALALRELTLAKDSLDALVDRETARLLLLDRTGKQPSALTGVLQKPAERATILSRIGNGLLSVGRPADAVPVLEQGLTLADTSSPGVTVELDLRFNLATALADTLPKNSSPAGPAADYSYYPSGSMLGRLNDIIRIRALVYQALAIDHSAATYVRGGRILLQIGDEVLGTGLLTQAIKLDPLEADAYLALGDWYTSHQTPYLALGLYAQAATLMPNNPQIISALADSTFNTGPHAEALPLLQKAAAMKNADVYVFAFLGDCYNELGQTADARAAWEEGLRRFPGAKTLTVRLNSLSAPAGSTR